MDIIEFAHMGGKARWKKVSKADRKKAMQILARKPRKKLSPPSKQAS